MQLWFQHPAEQFEEALPIGAGRFGAMLYGKPDCELLRLNEDSLWSGGARSRINPDAKAHLPHVRQLLRNGQIAEAEQEAFRFLQGCPPNMRHYQPMGDLSMKTDLPAGTISDYRRSLDLEHALYTVSFRIGDACFKREIFASYPAQCIVIRMTANQPFSVSAEMDGRDDDFDRCCIEQDADGKKLVFAGCAGGTNGIAFCTVLRAAARNGSVSSFGNALSVRQTTDVTLVCCMQTGYYHPQQDICAIAAQLCSDACSAGYDALLQAHLQDYAALWRNVAVTVSADSDDTAAMSPDRIPTDRLLQCCKEQQEAAVSALIPVYFAFGRYLMIAGSRAGSLPLNLQGIWNEKMWPAWGCRFTVNINTEMNYWLAGCGNLSECQMPLFDLLHKIHENGKQTAREMYGCRGFCCHHNTDLWGDTAPQDLWMPATLWPMGGAWLSLHIMEHYRFTQDLAFLRECYEILHDAALFFTDFLITDPAGRLLVSPSVSPENTYRLPNGQTGSLCEGAAMDSQIITALYQDVLEANRLLSLHDPLATVLEQQLPLLPQPQTGKYGQIMEWVFGHEETEPGHRHISQLFALHPAHQISPRKTPALAEAAARTLQRRLTNGGGHTGWSCAWLINLYARLRDGASAYKMLCRMFRHATCPNLFCLHPPFQIDGNFGAAAAISEMLLQSDADGITFLPALPPEWKNGSFTGLCTYGGFEADARWENGRLCSARIHARSGGTCRIELTVPLRIRHNEKEHESRKEADGFICFETVPDGVYCLTAE